MIINLQTKDDECSSCPPNPCMICQMQPESTNDATDDYDYEYEDDTQDDDAEEEDNVNIDDGLLDDAFEESGVDEVDVSPRGGECNTCDMAMCVMGGSDAGGGAVSQVSSVTAGSKLSRVPRGLYISPFPAFMTRGSGSTFSFYSNQVNPMMFLPNTKTITKLLYSLFYLENKIE